MKAVLTILYFCGLCYLVFFARRRESMQRSPRSELVNLVPVVHQIETFKLLNTDHPKEVWNFYTNLIGNVVLFIPLSILLSVWGISKRRQIFLIAVLTSCSIELVQYIFRIGVADVDDVLLNGAGACLGILFLHRLPRNGKAAFSVVSE